MSLARGDFNADASLDLIAAARAAALASVLLGKGDGTFNPKTDLGTDTEPIAVTAADFNADGKLDAVTANLGTYISTYYGYPITYYLPSLTLALGDGSGNFGSKWFSLNSIPTGIASGDFNADGRLDLAIANSRNDCVTILLQSADLSMSNTALNFSRIASGTTSAPQTVTIQSTGSFDLNISGVALSGTNPGDFSITGNTCSGTPMPSGSSCTLSAAFAPTATGSKNADLVVNSNAPGSPHNIYLSGTGAGAGVLTLLPTSLNFGNIKLGTSSAPQQSQLTNTGSGALAILGISVAGYTIVEFPKTTTCGNSLAAGASCSVSVTFTPSDLGTFAAAIHIDTDAVVSPTLIGLAGVGVGGVPSVSGGASFGNQAVNVTSAPQSITLTNVGDMDLVISAVAVTNNSSIFSQANNCVGTLAPTASCTINVTFTPLGSLHYTGLLSITHDSYSSPLVLGLSGTGFVPPVVSLSPTSLDFGNQIVATSSAAKTVTLTNTGGTVLNISSLTISGDYSKTDNCGASVTAAGSCTINVTFTPSTTGTRSGAVTITDDAAGSPHIISLTGNGVTPPGVSLSPTSLTFNPQLVGSTSAAQTVTLTNTGGATLTISNMALGGANAGDFTRSDNCGGSVNGGASCVITVIFKPTAAGNRAATVTINSNAGGSPHSVALDGTGTDFSVGAASGSSTSATVNPGGSASFTLSLAPTNGYVGTVAMSCTTSSPEVSCSVPASVAVNGPTNVSVNVTTTTRAWMPIRGLPPEMFPTGGLHTAAAWLALLLLLGAMFRWGRAQRGRMGLRLRPAVALAAIVLCAQLWTGCSGGSTPPPPRTYNITVNASAAGAVRSVELTVIVP
ncbi:MAG: choice-of-anchor D domain-containing protein [Acidobacteria bacterium]|nr:choice-of-anchor D domain-containing protein [Acidobacteriota bacterium]